MVNGHQHPWVHITDLPSKHATSLMLFRLEEITAPGGASPANPGADTLLLCSQASSNKQKTTL